MTTFKLRAAAKKAGYDRGPIEDGGGFTRYRKEFRRAGLWADLFFTGSYVGEEDIPAAVTHMSFTKIGGNRAIPLGKVPPLLLSEVWNDLHQIASAGAYDEDWQAKAFIEGQDMKTLLKKLIPGTTDNRVSSDLKRLNEWQKGLGDTAVEYVITGKPETVLSTISTVRKGDPLHVGTHYSRDPVEIKRPLVFLDNAPFDCGFLVRYAEVLAATQSNVRENVLGTEASPLVIAHPFVAGRCRCDEPERVLPVARS